MKSRLALWSCLALLGSAPCARAQMAPQSPNLGRPLGAPAENDAFTREGAQMARDFARGFYDDVVGRADKLIGDTPAERVDPRIYYWRGLTFYQLAWYPEAVEDLKRARAAGVEVENGGFGASATLAKIERVMPFVPPRQTTISSGGQVVFRVHYVSESAETREAIAALAPAYRASRALFGSDVVATSVYIFDTYEQFAAGMNARVGHPPEGWVAAVTINNVLYLPLRDRRGDSTAETNPDFFRSMIAHEFNHAMLRRLMGTAALPKWFSEGMADFAGGQVVPSDIERNDHDIKRLFQAKALISPTQLEDPKAFGAQTGQGHTMSQAGAGIAAPDTYAQSYHMIRYLLFHMKRDDLPDFLNLVRDKNNFSAAFAQQFGATVPQFYQSWYQDTGRRQKQ